MPDIELLKAARNIPGLIRLLDHRDFEVQWRAADALGTLGTDATGPLIRILGHPNTPTRLGAIEALGSIRDSRAVEPLIYLLNHDPGIEVRSAAALALGKIGELRATGPLICALREPERYCRYCAARALDTLQWTPCEDTERAYYFIALQDWTNVKKLGKSAIDPLIDMIRDPDASTRIQCVELLGQIGNPAATRACEIVLQDRDQNVRWKAIIAAKKCGVPITHLPWGLSKRHKTGRNPWAGAILNFFFIGLGYNYLGFWWGFLVFMTYMSIMVLFQLTQGPLVPYLITYPITALFAVQTFYLAKKMPDLE